MRCEIEDNRNVKNEYKGRTNEEIIADLETKKSNFSVLLINIEHDLNLSNIVRSANAFGAREVILFGKKHFDRRGCVGANHYIRIRNVKSVEELEPILKEYDKVVAAENNVNAPFDVSTFPWSKYETYLLVFGQESCGIPAEILDRCHYTVEIEQRGSVRSLNLAVAAGIIMYEVMK